MNAFFGKREYFHKSEYTKKYKKYKNLFTFCYKYAIMKVYMNLNHDTSILEIAVDRQNEK